jgi:hypothetical protein
MMCIIQRIGTKEKIRGIQIKKDKIKTPPPTKMKGTIGMPKMQGGLVAPLKITAL